MNIGVFSRTAIAAAAFSLTSGAVRAEAQEWADKLSLHGSLNTGYGKSDRLGVFGIDKDGTSDYRAIALQMGYKLDDKSRVVVQLLHRAIGSSPLMSIQPEVFPVWAFYERKVGDYTVKLGRNPLPRGIFNEVRFVGTLMPFFRESFYGETMENIDGAVVSRGFDLGSGWGLHADAFAGGFDVKYTLAGAEGTVVGSLRGKNSYGTQLWLKTPLPGLRVGANVNEWGSKSQVPGEKDARILTKLFSAEGDFSRFVVRAETQSFASGEGASKSDTKIWYTQAGIKLTEQFGVFGEFNQMTTDLIFPAPFPSMKLNATEDLAGALNYAPTANVKFKFELHRQTGYSFDSAVPTVIPPTAPPLVMSLAPRSKTNYGLLSVAVSF